MRITGQEAFHHPRSPQPPKAAFSARGRFFPARFFVRLLERWLFKLSGPPAGTVVLTQRRVFILPTRQGFTFGLLLILMLLGSVNYQLSLGYALTFLLGAMAVVSIFHTFRNLAGIGVRAGKVHPVFAGSSASFAILLENPSRLPRYKLAIAPKGKEPVFCDVLGGETRCVVIPVPAPHRGWLRLPRLTLYTRYPLGLFHAWSYVELTVRCLVYPQPDSDAGPLPLASSSSNGQDTPTGPGNEDFAGLRDYRPGDSPRHIAWKAAAQERGTFTKQFSGAAFGELWLDFYDLTGMETEARLARLARWVLEAAASGVRYGLRLPGKTLPPAQGEAHREECLRALALYGEGAELRSDLKKS